MRIKAITKRVYEYVSPEKRKSFAKVAGVFFSEKGNKYIVRVNKRTSLNSPYLFTVSSLKMFDYEYEAVDFYNKIRRSEVYRNSGGILTEENIKEILSI